ncbi:MAG: sigma-70 family RNA polymerase sigma factor [Planctomycetes bacterium]|nr:sigma-70 family RNA polymerase sigma factor [Planctomycetota bacterium]
MRSTFGTSSRPSTHADRLEQEGLLPAAVAALTPARHELLRQRYSENLSRPEIAQDLELPVSAVKSRLYDAISRLRSTLATRAKNAPAARSGASHCEHEDFCRDQGGPPQS